MVKTYYRSEYSDKQWRALIDTAAKLGCQVTYGKYGDRAVIDSTDRENTLVNGKEDTRAMWAEHIHKMLQDSTDLRKWWVAPKRYRKGYCPTICKSEASAKHEQERLERIINSPLARALDSYCHDAIVNYINNSKNGKQQIRVQENRSYALRCGIA